MPPLFSIITIAYNASATIGRTLRSVGEQTFRQFEYIIIDGASADGTADMARSASIANTVVFSSPDDGIYDAMNKGLGRAEGDYVIFLNAGDAFHSPDTLRHIADAIRANNFPGIVYGQTDIVDIDGNRLRPRHLSAPKTLTLNSFKQGMLVCHQAFVALRKITQPFDLRYRFSADYDWCIRCLQHSKRNVYIPETLIDYLNEGTTTRNRGRSLRERFSIMCQYYGTLPTIGRHFKFIPRFIRANIIRKRQR